MFDYATTLHFVTLSNRRRTGPRLSGVHWDGVNLSLVDWSKVRRLDDEHRARTGTAGGPTDEALYLPLNAYLHAVQANRQLAIVMRNQGISEDASRFEYRAQVLQRQVLRRQGRLWQAVGSWLLDMLAGYGYKPMRSVVTYIMVVLGFAAAYFALTNFGITLFLPSHLSPVAWYEALVLSISSFHGRGLFPTGLNLGDPIAILAAVEAIVGLLIEISFIATFTQRFFGAK